MFSLSVSKYRCGGQPAVVVVDESFFSEFKGSLKESVK